MVLECLMVNGDHLGIIPTCETKDNLMPHHVQEIPAQVPPPLPPGSAGAVCGESEAMRLQQD